jgi:3' exoribonuclease family, domain 2
VLDLDYKEDSSAETDANFVMTGAGHLVEVQATAEAAVFTEDQLQSLLALAKKSVGMTWVATENLPRSSCANCSSASARRATRTRETPREASSCA